MKMKRFKMLFAILGISVLFMPGRMEAAEEGKDTNKAIPLTAEYFPDDVLREYIKDTADTDGNGSLSVAERKAVSNISYHYYDHYNVVDGEDYGDRVIKQLTGIEWFPELETLDVSFRYGYQSSIKIEGFQRLKTLYIGGDEYPSKNPTESILIRDCPVLEEIRINGVYANHIKLVSIERCDSLEKLNLTYLSIDQLVLTDVPKLTDQWCRIWGRWPKFIDLRYSKSEDLVKQYGKGWDMQEDHPKVITPDYPESGWIKLEGSSYYLLKSGGVKIGWLKQDSRRYYCYDMTEFDVDAWLTGDIGARQTGWQEIKGKKYYFGADGVMRTGWKEIGGKRYYFGTDGVMRTGWKQIKERYFYFGTNGVMRTGWQKISDRWFYFGTDGVRRNDWQKIDNKWYYFGTNGVMRTGWQKIDNKWYFFTNGVMKTGWKQYKGEWYYFGGDGSMATGARTVGGKAYQFSADGVCLNP